ncbi:MAG: two-component response regulator [Deltaproteobacteria bacterium]|nr:two-component response regulator [Deltaproteobacteria bacterium]
MDRDRDIPVKFPPHPADTTGMIPTVGIPEALFGGGNGGQRVLVVDDEELLRAIVRERLEMAGYHVEEAASGEEALDKLGNGRYSVLLTDLSMSGMDGIRLLGEWSRRSPETAGIVMSANAELGTAVSALKMGACDYITKPFNFEVLLITIQNALRKKEIERQLLDYRINLERKVKEQTDLINSMYVRSIDALIKALEAKDFYTRGHSQRVTIYSVAIAREMGLPEEGIEMLRRAAVLHDLGKIGVREVVLNKPGRLTEEEFGEIVRHPETAMRILEPIPFFQPLLPAILHHHERFDGRGYPARLAGDRIPLPSRIMAVADTFDAMTSTRAYRKALPVYEANAEIRRCAGTQFDPEIVPLFLACQSRMVVPGDVCMPEGFDEEMLRQLRSHAV